MFIAYASKGLSIGFTADSLRGVSCDFVDRSWDAEYDPLNHTKNHETQISFSFMERCEHGF